MKPIITAILILSLLILLSGCIGDEPVIFIDNEYISKNLEVSVELNKTTFKSEDIITIPIMFKNNGSVPIAIRNMDINTTIYLPESYPTNSTKLRFIRLNSISVKPGKSIVQEIKWDQKYLLGSKSYDIENGQYVIINNVTLRISRTRIDDSFIESHFEIDPIIITIGRTDLFG